MNARIDPLVSPWHPMTDPVDLKHLGKLGEEACELGSAAARCVIQGVDAEHPLTHKLNREWLEDEIADVRAGSQLAIERFALNEARIANRAQQKVEQLRSWHRMA